MTITITHEDPSRPTEVETRPATLHESITKAVQTATLLRGELQYAAGTSDPVALLLIAPLIADAARIVSALAALESALERS